MLNYCLSILIGVLCFLHLLPHPLRGAETRLVTLMWWNVENCFDTRNDPATDDDDFTPSGRQKWTEQRLNLKLTRLAHAIRAVKAHPGFMHFPDIFACCEVENRIVFRQLLDRIPEAGYRMLYHDSHDPRGIDIALAYNPQTIKILSFKAYRVPVPDGWTRDILVAGVSAFGQPLWLILNHWPSRSFDRAWTEPKRLAAAGVARHIVDSLLVRKKSADIIVMGDFNDEPSSRSVKEVLRSTSITSMGLMHEEGPLYNCWKDTERGGSYHYKRKWEKIDQILLSAGLFDRSGFFINRRAFTCFSFSHLLMRSGPAIAPWPTFRGKNYLGGYSDHLPLLINLNVGE